MSTNNVKTLAGVAIRFSQRIDFPVAVSGSCHSDAMESMGYAIQELADIVKKQQLIINELTSNQTNKELI